MPSTSGIAIPTAGIPSPTNTQRQPAEGTREVKRRNRIRFSCVTCRDKKLKCDRLQPCDQCERRSIGHTCRYIQNHGKRDKERDPRTLTQLGLLQEEVHRLQTRLKAAGIPVNGPAIRTKTNTVPVLEETKPVVDVASVKKPAPAGSLGADKRYVDAENWAAVLEDVTEMTGSLATDTDGGRLSSVGGVGAFDDDDMDDEPILVDQKGPLLLLGAFKHDFPSLTDVFGMLPSKETVDFFIKRFFKAREPAWLMFHQPSFWRHYNEFWAAPLENEREASHTRNYSWIALLFIMIARSAVFCYREGESLPAGMGDAMSVLVKYRMLAARAMSLGDYTCPGRWKLEALILYFGTEYMRTKDSHSGSPILLSVIVRLAVHSGYHRDPCHFPELTVFEGEMRRRLWTILTELDVLVSFQSGVPPTIQPCYSDVCLPRNIQDDDFDEDTTQLPRARNSERTPALYTIVKSRLIKVFSNICSAMAAAESPSWEEIGSLEKELDMAHEAIPLILKMDPVATMTAVDIPADLIMHRTWIHLLYLKAKIVLHRRFFTAAWAEPKYARSRYRCIDAAQEVLQIQFDVGRATAQGGSMSKKRWFLDSLSTHDFLLANMILCLELGHLLRGEQGLPTNVTKSTPSVPPVDTTNQVNDGLDNEDLSMYHESPPIGREALLSLIRNSRVEWARRKLESREAQRAFRIITRMLTYATGNPGDERGSPEGMEVMQGLEAEIISPVAPMEHTQQELVGFFEQQVQQQQQAQQQQQQQTGHMGMAMGMGQMSQGFVGQIAQSGFAQTGFGPTDGMVAQIQQQQRVQQQQQQQQAQQQQAQQQRRIPQQTLPQQRPPQPVLASQRQSLAVTNGMGVLPSNAQHVARSPRQDSVESVPPPEQALLSFAGVKAELSTQQHTLLGTASVQPPTQAQPQQQQQPNIGTQAQQQFLQYAYPNDPTPSWMLVPDMSGTGLSNPAMSNPGMSNSALSAPGMSGPGMIPAGVIPSQHQAGVNVMGYNGSFAGGATGPDWMSWDAEVAMPGNADMRNPKWGEEFFGR